MSQFLSRYFDSITDPYGPVTPPYFDPVTMTVTPGSGYPGSEGISGSPVVPSAYTDVIPGIVSAGAEFLGLTGESSNGDCPGILNLKIAGKCVDVGNLLPGGEPAITGQTGSGNGNGNGQAFGGVTKGMYGAGIIPRVDVRAVRRCPKKYVLGDDGVCYKHLRKSDRAWDPGTKPLLTGGERNAIRRAAAAGRKIARSKKQLRQAARTIEKAC